MKHNLTKNHKVCNLLLILRYHKIVTASLNGDLII